MTTGAAWQRVRVDDVASIERDAVLPGDIATGTNYVGLEHIDSDGNFVGMSPVVSGVLASNKFRFGPKHILFGKLRPYLKKTARPDFYGICSTDIVPILPGPRVDRGFLFHFLRHPKTVEEAVLRCAGANLPRLSPRDLEALELPLPPLPEQRRIADILDNADAVRRKRKHAIALTEELLRSAFLEMFGDPVTNPKGWPVSTFGAELQKMEYGPRFYNEKYSSDGVRIVRITDLSAGGALDFESMPRLSMSEADRARYALKPGEIIFARTGATVGKTALVEEEAPECVAGAYFIRLQLKKRVLPRYARMVIASERVQAFIARRSRQSAQQNFSGPGIRELALPVPPLALQRTLETVAGRCAKVEATQRAHDRIAADLFDALTQQAFRGELGRA
ncbi:MAG: restriction endonuclease subunit S [Candidatus Eisenbacteria bacterium]|nr:restriction endonuclease subunit S [Candidatus Eisenbacteria bacterium]